MFSNWSANKFYSEYNLINRCSFFSSDSFFLHFNPQLKQLEKSISPRISLGKKWNCRSTAFSWHFENNGWMNDSSLMILEVSVYGGFGVAQKHFILSRWSSRSLINSTSSSSLFLSRKWNNPNKMLSSYTNTLELYNLFICNMISVIILFICLNIY